MIDPEFGDFLPRVSVDSTNQPATLNVHDEMNPNAADYQIDNFQGYGRLARFGGAGISVQFY